MKFTMVITVGFSLLLLPQMGHTATSTATIQTKYIIGFREINWCITGKDEPELHEFPFHQFIPLLRRDRRYTQADPNYRYSIQFYEIYSRMPINAEATCNSTGADEPWCIHTPIDCGLNGVNCKNPDYHSSLNHVKYIGRLYKTVHVIVKAEKLRDPSFGVNNVWEPAELQGLILQANHNPWGMGYPTGEFFIEDDIICTDCHRSSWGRTIPCRKRSSLEAVHPTVLIFHHQMVELDDKQDVITAGTKSEVHANFRWYSLPCLQTRRLEFTLLAVRSFKDNIYDVVSLGPYETYGRGHDYHPETIPTPIFNGYFYHKQFQGTWCHAASARDIQVVHPSVFGPFEMSPSYDECIRNEKAAQHQCSKPEQPICDLAMIDNFEHAYFLQQGAKTCSEVCRVPVDPGGTAVMAEPSTGVLKRNAHGVIMIMTNFFLLPISTFVARFYKETFNQDNFKGAKIWFWWHFLGCTISAIFIYFGSFHPGPAQSDFMTHIYLGRAYMIVLFICYLTAWLRHVKKWVNLLSEFIHGCLGYAAIILAHITMHFAPRTSWLAMFLCDLQIIVHCLFIIIMTVHICIMDKKFGIEPSRRHFLSVQAYFEEIPFPQRGFRILLLGILGVFTFSCAVAALFV